MEEKAEEPVEVIYQICRVCSELKPLSEFHRDKSKKLGHVSICKRCQSIRVAEYYLDHKKQILAHTKEYARRKREQIAEQQREYRLAHKKQIAEQKRECYLAHKKQIAKQQAKYCLAHKKQRAEQQREYRLKHKTQRVEYMKEYCQTERAHLLERCSSQRKRARKAEAGGDGVTPEEFVRIIKNQSGKCNLCGKNFINARPATIDHILALSKGGDHDSSNIQALCGSCNSSKHAKILKCFINSWVEPIQK